MCRAENENGVTEERIELRPPNGVAGTNQSAGSHADLRIYPEPVATADGGLVLEVEDGVPMSVSCVARVRWHGLPAVGGTGGDVSLDWELPALAAANQSAPTVGPLALLAEEAAARSTVSRNLSFANVQAAHAGNYVCRLRGSHSRNSALSFALRIVSPHVMCMCTVLHNTRTSYVMYRVLG